MKAPFDPSTTPSNAIFLVCSSHEDRCLGIARRCADFRPMRSVIFRYDDANPRREDNHAALCAALAGSSVEEVSVAEGELAESLKKQRSTLYDVVNEDEHRPIIVDVSVFTKRHLLLLLRWLDDNACWDRLWVTYSEPEEYEIEGRFPLSFGVSRVEQLPGFSASPDPSRPLHVAMFLGYEGDRAYATYELLQPRRTTLIIPDPPFRDSWRGRTEELNRNLISVVGEPALLRADSLDPMSSYGTLENAFGPVESRSQYSRALCPLGTKPQIVGAYLYLRRTFDPPAVIYTGALRHNHSYYSRGVGKSWLIYRPS